MTTSPIIAYKGFDKNLRCRQFQFEVGQSYTHEGAVRACGAGFHACVDPFDVLSYYPATDGNRFARVELSGTIDAHGDGTKHAAETIRVVEELGLVGLVDAAIKFACKKADGPEAASGDDSTLATSGGHSTLATSGRGSTAKAGPNGAIALAYWDGARPRFAVGYVGEDGIEADVEYRADLATGKLVRA